MPAASCTLNKTVPGETGSTPPTCARDRTVVPHAYRYRIRRPGQGRQNVDVLSWKVTLSASAHILTSAPTGLGGQLPTITLLQYDKVTLLQCKEIGAICNIEHCLH